MDPGPRSHFFKCIMYVCYSNYKREFCVRPGGSIYILTYTTFVPTNGLSLAIPLNHSLQNFSLFQMIPRCPWAEVPPQSIENYSCQEYTFLFKGCSYLSAAFCLHHPLPWFLFTLSHVRLPCLHLCVPLLLSFLSRLPAVLTPYT